MLRRDSELVFGHVDVPVDGPEHTRPIFYIDSKNYSRAHYDAFVNAGLGRGARLPAKSSALLLESKVKELEAMLRLKDMKIATLSAQLQQHRSVLFPGAAAVDAAAAAAAAAAGAGGAAAAGSTAAAAPPST